jgi:hypothetical protein
MHMAIYLRVVMMETWSAGGKFRRPRKDAAACNGTSSAN